MLEVLFPNINYAKLVVLALCLLLTLAITVCSGKLRRVSFGEAALYVFYILITSHFYLFSYNSVDSAEFQLYLGAIFLLTVYFCRNAIGTFSFILLIKRLSLWFSLLFVGANILLVVVSYSSFVTSGNFYGLISNSNMLAAYFVVICIPSLFSFAFNESRPRKYLYWCFVAAAIIVLFLSRSRTGLLALIFLLFYMVFIWRKISISKKFITAILLVFVATFSSVYFINKYEGQGVFSTRDKLFQLRFDAISEKPFLGHGYGSQKYSQFDYFNIYNGQEKGNTLLAVFEEFGLVMGLAIMILLGIALKRAIFLFGSSRETSVFAFSLITASVSLMFETWLFQFSGLLSLYFWVLIILSFSLPKSKRWRATIN